jgi:RNA polymerase sigma factor (sigma-70 family)
MPPPPAEPFASRIFLGPALRTQPDRRLVKLVREGYESAFEEIVRRYRKPLDRFAAAIVGGRSEDVTQDAFSKALLALRGTTAEIELKPWLYRIVRNTALNDLRDGPPPTEELGETIAGGQSAAVEVERREEIAELIERLRALPESQRAAIVMRELEGLSHEEIAAALGISGGGARQAIYRARAGLRDGLGMLIPLPLLRMLFDHGAETAGLGAGAAAAAGAASAAGGGTGAALGGLGVAGALKVGVATALLAGSVGAGVAMQRDGGRGGPAPAEASAVQLPSAESEDASAPPGRPRGLSQIALVGPGEGRGHDGAGSGEDMGRDSHRGAGSGNDDFEDSSHGGSSSGPGGPAEHGGQGSSHGGGGHSGPGDGAGEGHSGEDVAAGGHSGRHGPGGSGGGSGSGAGGPGGGGSGGSGSGGGGSHGGSGGGGSGGSGSGGPGGSGTSDPPPATSPAPAPAPPQAEAGDGSGGSGSEGGGSGSGESGSGGGEDDS